MADDISDRKSPGFWFYTSDFEKDMQILPLAAQGLWIRMMCWASENEIHRGFLELPTGDIMTDLDIAHRVGKPIKEVRSSIAAMRRIGTFSEDARGCIFSRRMARDTHISEVRRQAALKRASLVERAKDGSFAPPKPPAKPEQTPTVTASASASASASVAIKPATSEVRMHGEFPDTGAAIREKYPETDDAFIVRLTIAVGQKAADANGKLRGNPTDQLIADAVRHCARASPNQNSAGLYLKTVPQCVTTWLTQGKPGDAPPSTNPIWDPKAFQEPPREK